MKKVISLLCSFVLLLTLAPAAFAAASDLVYEKDATLSASFVAYRTITVKSGATLTITSGSGFEILDGITVEPGAALICNGEGKGDFNFSIKHANAVISGIELYWKNRDTGEVRKIPGGWSSVAALDCWDFEGGWVPSFKWNSSVQGWCLTESMNGNPFNEVVYHSERDMETAERMADSLNRLHLFKGVGTGADGKPNYDLARSGSRQEALVMLIRLLGKEEEALTGSWTCPFTDVDGWAMPYVAYAYENGLTNGSSATEFGKGTCTAQMYYTFLLRALGYSVDDSSVYANALSLAHYHTIDSTEHDSYVLCNENFWRADMVVASYRLMEIGRLDGEKMARKLITDGVFTEEEYNQR